MELVKLGQKGQVTIPRVVLRAAGVEAETTLAVEVAPDGAIVLRAVGVYPLETYTPQRIAEFELHNRISEEVAARAAALVAERKARG